MKNKLKTLSGNDLCELADMMGRVLRETERSYSHVSEHMPQSTRKALKKFNQDIHNEIDRRANQ
jgi:predicted DNA-binding protein (UPF0278 family)